MKKRMKWIVVLVLIAGGVFWFKNHASNSENEAKPSYDVVQVERRDLRTTVESTGEVEPRNRLDVKPPIGGRLEELLVDEGDVVEKGQILGWISSTERATLLDAALATSKEEYGYWQELYKPSPLVSPLKGTIIARNFEPGQTIASSSAVVVIADDLIVVANLDETDIGQVKNGQAVKMTLEAYPDREFGGEVEKMAYDAKTVSNVTMYEVDVRPARVPPFMRSGMTANLEFVVEEKSGALVLPASAIQQKAGEAAERNDRPNFEEMSADERKQMMMERMRERGMSESEIEERLARFAEGGGRQGKGRNGESRKKKNNDISYVLVASDDPELPTELVVKTGMSDGSFIEVVEGLEEGAEVLIPQVNLGGGKSSGGSLFMPTRGGGGRR